MSYLINEILLRLAKLVAAGIVGAILYLIALVPLQVSPSFELAALCWISAGVALLLVESGPI
jgi:membrane-bound ClpP family serine protease